MKPISQPTNQRFNSNKQMNGDHRYERTKCGIRTLAKCNITSTHITNTYILERTITTTTTTQIIKQ